MPRHIAIILGVMVVAAIILRFMYWVAPVKQSFVSIGDKQIAVEIARTPAEHARGLSNRLSLSDGNGMLFLFERPTTPNFWMRGMFIPLDMIWIADGRIVGITADVPPPVLGTQGSALLFYTPPQPVTMVLEVGGGVSARAGWKVGDAVRAEL